MTKSLSEFICQTCGARSPAFLGKCPQCGVWGSYVETPITTDGSAGISSKEKANVIKLGEISPKPVKRILTNVGEVDRVLGGGLVPGSVVLVSGEPGIGKSTLLAQVSSNLAGGKLKTVYVTGEESCEQIKIRADRVSKKKTNGIWLAAETDIEKIINTLNFEKPDVVIIDSIQTMSWSALSGTPGSIGQVRECARILHQLAKTTPFILILVGHVTKEGVIAGPKILEHLVDVVLQFEGDTQHNFRILRSSKNRYGAVSEVGVFEMTDTGLMEVANPSKFFLEKSSTNSTGSAIFASISGTRAILAEIQALATPTNFSQPRRVVNGLEYNRINQLLAVISKIFKIPVNNFDIYVSVAGGLQITETAADLPAALCLLSFFWDKPLRHLASAAEIGLLGELREVSQIETRKKEAARAGFSKFAGSQLKHISAAAKFAF